MNIYKNKGIGISQYFLDILSNRLDRKDIQASVEVFNNCREQGYIIRISTEDYTIRKGLTFYIYAQRNSDKPTMTWEDKLSYNDMYSEEAYRERTISKESVEELADTAIAIVYAKYGMEVK